MLGVGRTDAVELLAREVEGVILREDEAAGVLVDGIVGGAVAQVGGGEQGGDVGVVHEVVVAQAVGLVGVDAAVLGVIHQAVLLDAPRSKYKSDAGKPANYKGNANPFG